MHLNDTYLNPYTCLNYMGFAYVNAEVPDVGH